MTRDRIHPRRLIRDFLVMKHPDHRQKRRQRKRDQECRELVTDELDLGNKENHHCGKEHLYDIKKRRRKSFKNFRFVHC